MSDLSPEADESKKLFAFLYQKQKELDEKINKLEDLFVNGLVTPMVNHAKATRYGAFRDGFKEAHPEFGQFGGILKDLHGVEDPFDMVGQELWDNEKAESKFEKQEDFDAAVKEAFDFLSSKFGKYLSPEQKQTLDDALDAAVGVDDHAKPEGEPVEIEEKDSPDIKAQVVRMRGRLPM